MDSNTRRHLSDETLVQFQEDVLSGPDAEHLASCEECRARLHDIAIAGAAYVEYRDHVRGPQLPPAPNRWMDLGTLVAQHKANHTRLILRWWPATACVAACALVIMLLFPPWPGARATRRMNELLQRSIRNTEPQGLLISMRFRGRTMVRPAVMTDSDNREPYMAHLQTMFMAARYNWKEPLSTRSFQAWRSGLRRKQDTVSVVRQDGEEQSYRVRTDSPTGTLKSVSLTLRAGDLRPVNGSFTFEGEGEVESSEITTPVAPPPARQVQTEAAPPVETLATPADTLQVLAALNKIGADVGEPIRISEDPERRHVVVSAGNLSTLRRQQVAQVLGPLPRVKLRFDAPAELPASAEEAAPSYSNIPAALRERFEQRLGGALRVQEITDDVLEASSLLLSRAHALQLLAEKLPPAAEGHLADSDRMILQHLRRNHLMALQSLLAQIERSIRPLLLPATPSNTRREDPGHSWQEEAGNLVRAAKESDDVLNQLLAGSYSQQEGEEMLGRAGRQIERLAEAINASQPGGK